jgi:hypothetical protein
MKAKCFLLTFTVCLLFITAGAFSFAVDLNPLDTERAATIGEGNLRLDVMGTVESIDDDIYRYHIPGARITYGISDITDLILSYGGLIIVESDTLDTEWGSGDLTVGLKVSPWKNSWGTLGFLIATKLPNASDDTGLGTDVQDFYFMGLYSLSQKHLTLNLNAGLAAIGDNTRTGNHHYLFAYGVGLEFPIGADFALVADVTGMIGEDGYNIHEATGGIVGPLGWGWEWAVTGSVGLSSDAPDWSAGVFLSKTWGLPGLMSADPLFADVDPYPLIYYPFPLNTAEAWTVKKNTLYTRVRYEVRGYDDDALLSEAPSFDIRYGIARGVDMGVVIPYLFLDDSPIYGDTDGLGRVKLNFKLSPWQVKGFRFGILSEVTFPTSNDKKGLGTEEMDYTALFLTSFVHERFAAHLNLGFAIEGDQTNISSQNDYFVASLGLEYALTDWASIYGEFYGKISDLDNLASYEASGGLRFLLGKWTLFLYGGGGFNDPDPDWKAGIGIARLWGF